MFELHKQGLGQWRKRKTHNRPVPSLGEENLSVQKQQQQYHI